MQPTGNAGARRFTDAGFAFILTDPFAVVGGGLRVAEIRASRQGEVRSSRPERSEA
jgi:hypothetical protein